MANGAPNSLQIDLFYANISRKTGRDLVWFSCGDLTRMGYLECAFLHSPEINFKVTLDLLDLQQVQLFVKNIPGPYANWHNFEENTGSLNYRTISILRVLEKRTNTMIMA